MPPTRDLDMLLAACARRDEDAFKTLYDRTAPKILGILLRLLRDRPLAEDVLQDTFLRIWTSSASYAPGSSSAMTWMAAVARHRAIDVARSRRVVPVTLDEVPDEALSQEGDLFGDPLAERRLAACLKQLDPEHERCFRLAYLDGFSRDELATEFGRPVNTIKTWLHRSAGALRLCLGSER